MPLFKKPVFYVTNDVERALWPGWEREPNYYIVTYRNPYSEWLAQGRKRRKEEKQESFRNLFLVNGKKGSTEELMKHNQVIKFIKSESQKVRKSERQEINILVFKPTAGVEEYCKKMGWKILNPSSRFAEQFEEKIAQTALFQKLKLRIPKMIVGEVGNIYVQNRKLRVKRRDTNEILRQAQDDSMIELPAILQFNLGHTGEGTYLIRRKSDLQKFQRQFPKRPVRMTEYIRGVPITVNAVVGRTIYVSAPSLQITGVPALTALPFATVGNDWSWVSRHRERGTWIRELRKIVIKIGNELKKEGYRGAFGVDFVVGDDQRVYVIETNIRQASSCVYESEIQDARFANRESRMRDTTTMGLHFRCLLGRDTGKERLPETLEGAQVFVRAQDNIRWDRDLQPQWRGTSFSFSQLNKGDDVRKNAEIVRIQSREGMVGKPMRLRRSVMRLVRTLTDGLASKFRVESGS